MSLPIGIIEIRDDDRVEGEDCRVVEKASGMSLLQNEELNPTTVIPAQAGIHNRLEFTTMDSRQLPRK